MVMPFDEGDSVGGWEGQRVAMGKSVGGGMFALGSGFGNITALLH
jgi:hypothetical protein